MFEKVVPKKLPIKVAKTVTVNVVEIVGEKNQSKNWSQNSRKGGR